MGGGPPPPQNKDRGKNPSWLKPGSSMKTTRNPLNLQPGPARRLATDAIPFVNLARAAARQAPVRGSFGKNENCFLS